MMLDVITVVEKQKIIKPAVVAGGAAFVLEMSLELAKAQTDHPPGEICLQEKVRRQYHQGRPQREDEAGFPRELGRPTPAPRTLSVMGKVSVAPKPLGDSQQQTFKRRKCRVQALEPEKWPMNEMMCDGVGVPPQAEGNQENRGKGQ
jgi:hypothetical protein